MLTRSAVQNSVQQSNRQHRDPSKKEWVRLTTPPDENQKEVDPGSKTGRETYQSMDQVIAAVDALDFHPLDAYVASVAAGVDARSVSDPESEHVEQLAVSVEEFYGEPIPIEFGRHHGPDAPLMIILPGIYGNNEGGFPNAFKKIALERGMNYAVISNPLNTEMISDEPKHHPGNIQLEAEATHAIIKRLSEKKPDYFDNVNVAGYSYGALLAANVAKFDEVNSPDGKRTIQGGVVALSPPQNLVNSMRQLDSLREGYAEGAGSITATGLYYTVEVGEYGYEKFMESELATRGPGTNITEIKIADHYGSRDEMKDMVAQVDEAFQHEILPPVWPEYFKRRRVLNEMTYDQYTADWFSKDPWLVEQGISAEELAVRNSFESAIDTLKDTPVLALVSQDDYILNADDVSTYRELQESSEGVEYTRVLDHGGHVGLLFNPEVQNVIGDFAFSSDKL